MNCQDFEKLVLALARDQLLEAGRRAQGMAHTEVCARCAARLAEERALLVGMHLVVAELAREAAPARVETALLTAFRAQAAHSAPPLRETLAIHRRLGQWRMVAACAAVILLAVLVSVTWLKRAADEQKQIAQHMSSPTPSPDSPKEAPASQRISQVEEPKLADMPTGTLHPRPRHRMRRAFSNTAEETEVVTQFFPLREGEDLAALESMRMFRVELPGSALGEVGLPVAPDAANMPVKADVMLGDDGLARAIRFVR
jgi:hypothetical protein